MKDPNQEAINRTRDVAKWLIVVFGAIGGVLLTGTQLSDVGAVTGWDWLFAVLGMLFGLVGAGIALYYTVGVLLPTTLSLKDLAETGEDTAFSRYVERDPGLVGDYGSATELYDAVEEKRRGGADEAEREEVEDAANVLLRFALLVAVRTKMERAVRAMFGGGTLVAIGIVLFSIATHQDAATAAESVEAVPKQPSAVSVELSEHGRNVLTKRVGDRCPKDPLRAIALGGDPDALELVSIPSADCEATRFTLTENMGVAVSDERVESAP